jgi:hypothetical protein
MHDRLGDLVDAAHDRLGLDLQTESLPKRICGPRKKHVVMEGTNEPRN